MSASFDLTTPNRVTVGALGPPGQRIFYLQARQESLLVSLKLEKEQVLFLAVGLNEVLAGRAGPSDQPAASEPQLEEPVLAEWTVGTLQIGYDPIAEKVVVVATELGPETADEEIAEEKGRTEDTTDKEGSAGESIREESGVARFALTRDQAAVIVENGKALLRASRPRCPLCGYPDSEDHSCPKTNGHSAPRP
ncbi:MAG TPA: DUF3090 family protein [Acidimicrobiales bacterium]|nr:DUF3090 family protein [Acidimicrobiales bacterium]